MNGVGREVAESELEATTSSPKDQAYEDVLATVIINKVGGSTFTAQPASSFNAKLGREKIRKIILCNTYSLIISFCWTGLNSQGVGNSISLLKGTVAGDFCSSFFFTFSALCVAQINPNPCGWGPI
jgi:hypothetical protein